MNIYYNMIRKQNDISVQFSHSVVSDSLQLHGLQHARLPCPSPTARVCSSSCPLNGWCHPAQCLNAWSHLILNKLQWAGPLLSQFSKWGNDIRQRLCPLPRATQPRNRYEFSGSFGTPLLFCLPYDFLMKSQWQSQSRNEKQRRVFPSTKVAHNTSLSVVSVVLRFLLSHNNKDRDSNSNNNNF